VAPDVLAADPLGVELATLLQPQAWLIDREAADAPPEIVPPAFASDRPRARCEATTTSTPSTAGPSPGLLRFSIALPSTARTIAVFSRLFRFPRGLIDQQIANNLALLLDGARLISNLVDFDLFGDQISGSPYPYSFAALTTRVSSASNSAGDGAVADCALARARETKDQKQNASLSFDWPCPASRVGTTYPVRARNLRLLVSARRVAGELYLDLTTLPWRRSGHRIR
jgi:hypothetical protein